MINGDRIPQSDKVKILSVDDHPANLLALEAVLSNPLYKIVGAASGREALKALMRDEFALILLDVQMPEMDGFETATRIRQDSRFRHLPIIFITAVYSETQFVMKGYETGAVDYIIKPFEPAILKSKVSVFADLYCYRRELLRRAEALHFAELERARQAELLRREQEERQRAEESKRYFEDLVNRLDHSIVWEAEITRSSILFRFVSRRSEMLLGYPQQQWFEEEDFLLKHTHPEDREKFRGLLNKSHSQGTDERCEHRMVAKDGRVYWFHTGIQAEKATLEGLVVLRGLSVEISDLMAVRTSAA
ncbi:MAG: response regulator [Bdellovibrionota bacterium]